MKTEQPPVIHLSEYAAPAFRIGSVALEFDLDPDRTLVATRLELARADRGETPLSLDGEDLDLLEIAIDGAPLAASDYVLTDTGLTIAAVPAGDFVLTTKVAIAPVANTRLEGLYQSNGIYCTQCEAEGFRRITFFPDRPDVMTTYRVTIRAPKTDCPVLLSNGNLVESRDLPDGRHEAVWDDPFAKPSYLFALVAGDLAHIADRFTTRSGQDVDLRIYVEHGNENRAGYAMDSLIRSMKWDEDRFGLEYDLGIFNIVAISDFNMGAMENKSLNVFNAKYVLADTETATDADFANIESIVGHEYFHNWTGNRVTCRDWFQLSLKEGLTVFRDQEFSADERSRAVTRIKDVRALRARQFPEDAGPLAHPVRPESYMEINNFYTATVYEKGAEVIRMMHGLLGEEGFQAGMRLYFERHDGQAVTCDDFAAAMADATGTDLDHFKLWYSQAGTPEVTAGWRYDAEAQTLSLELTQSSKPTPGQPKKAPLLIPIRVGLLDAAGEEMPLIIGGENQGTTATLQLSTDRQSFVFENVTEKPVPSLNRGFSAPVNLRAAYEPADLAFLMAHDSDPFARWEAGQQFAVTLLLDRIAAIQEGRDAEIDPAFIDAFALMLDDADADPDFRALAIALPSEEFLGEQMRIVDVDAIAAARQGLRRHIGEALWDRLMTHATADLGNAESAIDAVSAGRRALRAAALAYLGATGRAEAVALAKTRYNGAATMTDRMAALSVLNDIDCPEREAALADFETRFRDDEQVMDKWFAIQAISRLPDVLDRLKPLLDHPVFSWKKPNKVRSVIGAFAAANPVAFNAESGAGYDFLADSILTLDKLNPQVAARMLGTLGHWRRFDENRQTLMRGTLERVLATEGLSRDCTEIATKALGD